MKVHQLIKELQKHDPNREVILSSDSEGNSYSLLTSSSFHACDFRQDEEYGEIELGLGKLTPELKCKGYSEEDVLEDGKPALVIYP